jgi:hypothetical protein
MAHYLYFLKITFLDTYIFSYQFTYMNISFSFGTGLAQSVWCLTTGWATGVRSPAEAKDFSSSLCVHTGSETHPDSYPMGTGGRFPGVKRGRGVTLTTHTHLVPRSRMSRSRTSSSEARSDVEEAMLVIWFINFNCVCLFSKTRK